MMKFPIFKNSLICLFRSFLIRILAYFKTDNTANKFWAKISENAFFPVFSKCLHEIDSWNVVLCKYKSLIFYRFSSYFSKRRNVLMFWKIVFALSRIHRHCIKSALRAFHQNIIDIISSIFNTKVFNPNG